MSKDVLREIEQRLAAVAEELNEVAKVIRSSDLDSRANIRKIGEALASISDVRNSIYLIEPGLAPTYLRKAEQED